MTDPKQEGYLHGYSDEERSRLRRQARFLEPKVHDRLPFHRRKKIIEIGSGVGAQTEILLRYFPELEITCIERNSGQIADAKRFLETIPWTAGRYELCQEDATRLSAERETFDGAFLCWILEHVPNAARVLSEARRVLKPGAPIVVTEVVNSSFFVEPYSPKTLQYWLAFNDHQFEMGGDPFIGAKLGNLLQTTGFSNIRTDLRTFHFDNRSPGERAEFLGFWTDLLLSGAPSLIEAGLVSQEVVDGMREELDLVARSHSSVFLYSFMQARATA